MVVYRFVVFLFHTRFIHHYCAGVNLHFYPPPMVDWSARRSNICYTIHMKQILIAILVVIVLGGVGYTWFYFLPAQNAQVTNKEPLPPTDISDPTPQEYIRVLSGVVKNVSGSKIEIEIDDVEDYLPHADGTPRLKDTRYSVVSQETKLTLIDLGKLDAQGSPAITAIKLSDIKPGERVNVESNVNLRDAKTFEATSIDVIKLPI